MGRMVPVDEWAEIHGKTHATVMRKIYANAWPQAQKVYQNGKSVWLLDEDWLWPLAMAPTKQAKLLCEIRHLMPPGDLRHHGGRCGHLHGDLHQAHPHCLRRDRGRDE